MWERFDPGRAHGQIGIEEMRQPNAIAFGGEAQQAAIRVEGVAAAGLEEFE